MTDSDGVATTTYAASQTGLIPFIAFAGGSQSLAIICAAVEVIAIKANGRRYEDGDTIFVSKGVGGAHLTLDAVPSPNAQGLWPDGQPVWSGQSTPAISRDVPIDTASANSEGTGYSVSCCDSTVVIKIVVCEVAINPIPVPGNDPDISPNMCINAQDHYKKARWKATVKPPDSTATVLVSGNALGSALDVTDGQEIEVTPNAPDVFGPGEYGIKIVHNDVEDCMAEKDHLKVFELLFEDASMAHGPVTAKTPDEGGTFKKSTAKTTDPRSFETAITITLLTFDLPISIAAFTQTATWQYKLVTEPKDSFAGEVECPTTITTTIAPGDSALMATGILAAWGIGASDSHMDLSDEISVAGLANGNGAVSRSLSVDAPTLLFVPFDGNNMDGTTTWTNETARYTVGALVSAEDKLTMSASRGGAVPILPTATGFAKNSGFEFTNGAFTIKSKADD